LELSVFKDITKHTNMQHLRAIVRADKSKQNQRRKQKQRFNLKEPERASNWGRRPGRKKQKVYQMKMTERQVTSRAGKAAT